MKFIQNLFESIIEKLCKAYFNRYDLLVECHFIEGRFLTLYNDYIIDDEE